jgi:hypothetical protein
MGDFLRIGVLFICAVVVVYGLVWTVGARRRRPNYYRCKNCNYDLTGHLEQLDQTVGFCPECGNVFDKDSVIPPGVASPIEKENTGRTVSMLSAIACLSVLVLPGGWSGGAVSRFIMTGLAFCMVAGAIVCLYNWLNPEP